MRRVSARVLAGSAFMLAATATAAQSAPSPTYVYVDNGVLRVACVRGNNNVVTIKDSGSKVIVQDAIGVRLYNDTCKLTNSTTVTCDRPERTIVVDLNDGNDTITTSSSVTTSVYGQEGDDVINGSPYADFLYGDGGNDVVNGNGGNDRLTGGAGNDVVNGGDGDDTFIYDPDGNDTISGGPGNDVIEDSSGKDTISGGPGDDTILSQDSVNDVIDCGPGNDSYRTDTTDVRMACETKLP
jgi:Ca2+-binding RTX toxin-like protein